ncbi:hypothetical protein K469DRAFT_219916 [Zopfia rhizophila CBS 207.26]|uniref:Uncharacterized protein n=1 Tax=Zopfia rhizophila CBS 207.26 TaxID=1314779 RepID=A0A6A6DSY7_9PEZI|nr:hypothetical protein K469DRAFT_219916 [Zopfia rhizophila CBS 207.26]
MPGRASGRFSMQRPDACRGSRILAYLSWSAPPCPTRAAGLCPQKQCPNSAFPLSSKFIIYLVGPHMLCTNLLCPSFSLRSLSLPTTFVSSNSNSIANCPFCPRHRRPGFWLLNKKALALLLHKPQFEKRETTYLGLRVPFDRVGLIGPARILPAPSFISFLSRVQSRAYRCPRDQRPAARGIDTFYSTALFSRLSITSSPSPRGLSFLWLVLALRKKNLNLGSILHSFYHSGVNSTRSYFRLVPEVI